MRRLPALVLAAVFLAPTSACGGALASAELYQQSVDKMRLQKTFHLDGQIELAVKGNASMSFSLAMGVQGDVVLPDGFRGAVNVAILGENIAQEILVVGGRTWSRQSGATWTETATSSAGTTGLFVDAKLVKSIQELAPEAIDGRSVRHLLVDFDLATLAQSDERASQTLRDLASEFSVDQHAATLKLDHWVDAESGFIRRQRVALNGSVPDGSVVLTMVLDYTKIGQAIQPPIEAPR